MSPILQKFIVDYMVVIVEDSDLLGPEVSEKVKEGWTPFKKIVVTDRRYMQAMVRYDYRWAAVEWADAPGGGLPHNT